MVSDRYLGGVLLQHADGLRVETCGIRLQVGDGAVGLDGQDGVGLGHVDRVLNVSSAAILQLHLLEAALIIRLCRQGHPAKVNRGIPSFY